MNQEHQKLEIGDGYRMMRCPICSGGTLMQCVLPSGHLGDHAFPKDEEPIKESPALLKQVGGNHYKDLAIQPVEFCQRNRFGYCESAAIKYISRHRGKGTGAEDIRKAIHYLELLLEIEYKS